MEIFWVFCICIVIFILGFLLGLSIENRNTKKYTFVKNRGAFVSLIFDGQEYVPVKWFDEACRAFYGTLKKYEKSN